MLLTYKELKIFLFLLYISIQHMLKTILIFIFSLALLLHPCHSVKIQLPVSQATLAKVILSIDQLEDLLASFNTKLEKKDQIFNRVQLTKSYLLEIRTQLALYNSVIAGLGNQVKGNKNIVIGNYNAVQGSNNWVFVSGFTGRIDGVLMIGQWIVELQKSLFILKSPRLAISYINQQKNIDLKNIYGTDKRQLAIWKNLKISDNQEADKYWSRYVGYQERKMSKQDQKNLRVNQEDVKSGSSGSVNIISGWKESSAKLALNANSWIDFFKFSTSGGANVANANTGTTQTIVTAKNFNKPVSSSNVTSTILDNKFSVGSGANSLGK